MIDLTTPNGVTTLMKSSKSEQEWNNNCDAIKRANNGYPTFWFAYVVMSGLAAQTQSQWEQEDKL